MTSLLPCRRRSPAAAVLALVLLACGGNDASPPPAPPPTVTGAAPASGPTSGGTVVTVTGTGFQPGATAVVGGATAAVSSVTATALTLVTPSGAAGAATVAVTNPDGQSGSMTGAFTYMARPVIGSLVPATGPTAGGTVVTLAGSGFRPGVSVTFGGSPATVSSVTPSALALVTPAGASGAVAVTVANTDGQSDQLPAAFTYVAPPSISGLAPASGPAAGGTSVTVTGSDFRPGAAVTVDGSAVPVTGLTSTSLTIVTPPGIAGPAVLTVTNPDAQSGSATFTYVAPPVISALAPASGPSAGGTAVHVTGTGFQQGATATVGGAGAAVSSVTATTLTLVTPAGAPGPATVVVTNPDGQSATSAGGYGYVAAPALTGLAPSFGPLAGGTAVVVTGTGFQAGLTVSFGGSSAAIVSVTATSLTVTTPPHAAGPVDVVVTNPDAQSQTAAGAFTYRPAPAVASVAPPSGPARGGTTLTVTGAGFLQGATVTVGRVNALSVVVASPTTITCATPPHGAGGASVVVTNPDGQASTAAVQFTFVDAPSISSIDPGIVPTAGGAAVVIQGSAFASPARAFFGGVEATGTTVVSTTQIAATVPPHAAGAVDVIVQNPDGQQATLASAISYSDAPPPPPAASPPTLASLSPSSGLDSGGTPVTLTGTNFDATVTVTFGGAPATVISVTPTTLGVVTPVHADGAVDVAVTNAAGQATLAGAYTYLAPPPVTPPPVLSAVSPAQGPVTGGTSVTLTGSAFDRPTVTFGGVLASVLSSSATSITAVAPPSPAGPVAVTVTNFDGQSSTQAAAFTFTAAPPVVTGLSPSTGTAGAATPLTITGTGFVAGATVAFGGTPATGVTVQSATSITATSPALPAGTVNVAVTNPDAQVSAASNASAFTFAPGGGLPAPVISSIDPTTAVFTGGQPFTLTGSNFLGGATVTVGGVAALNVIVGNTGLSITGTIPAGAPGPAAVVVRNVDGQSATFNGFSYVNPPPVILALNVEGAPFAGGAIFIAGTGFAATATVTFGGVPSPSVVQDPNTGGLTVAVPAFTGTPDPVRGDAFVPLVVTNPDNQSATWSKQFHYGPPPSVTSLANPPPGGGLAVVKKGDAITITGVNFSADTTGIRAGLQVLVAGTVATITSKSPTQIVFTAPKANPGTYPVSVTNFDKQNTITTFPNLLTYPGP